MKIKVVLPLIVLTILSLKYSFAQSVFGIKGGMQLAKMTGFEDVPKSLLPTVQIKGIAILPLTEEVTIDPSLGYSGKGYKWNIWLHSMSISAFLM